MLCARCLRRLPKSSRLQCFRLLSTTLSNHLPSNPPAATSTSAAQPFSTPFTPTPSSLGISSKEAPLDSDGQPRKRSSVEAGTVLKGLGFIKGKEAPLAKDDSEYPEWLWGLLDKDKLKDEQNEKGEADMFSKSKKQRRLAAKRARKAGIDPASLIPKTPIQAQTVDLPHGDGSGGDRDIEAQKAREEVKAAMRKARKKQIKERNFLITMK